VVKPNECTICLWPGTSAVDVQEAGDKMARNYKKEYANYQGQPEQIKRRSMRNKARRKLMKQGRVRKGDGKDVDHRNPIVRGGGNSASNLRVQTDNENRSFPRDRNAKMRRAYYS